VQIIVPLAGKGTRLLPLTKRVPKPLVRVAGRPVMDYVMDTVKGLSVDELIVITGHLKETVERYIVEHYPIKARFVEQKTLDGTAGAINLARPFVKGPVLIIFVDTLFDADLSLTRTSWRRRPEGGASTISPTPSSTWWTAGDGCTPHRWVGGTTAARSRRCSRPIATCSSRGGPASRRGPAPVAPSCRRSTSRTA